MGRSLGTEGDASEASIREESGQRLSKSCLGGGGPWCVPRPSRTTLRRHLCQDNTSLAGPALLPIASLPATRPVFSEPSTGQAPRRSVFHRENAFSTQAEGRGRRGRMPEGRVHRGPPPQSAAGLLKDTRAAREPSRGVEGAARASREEGRGSGRPRRKGWVGIRAPSLGTPNLEPRSCSPAVLAFSISSFNTF